MQSMAYTDEKHERRDHDALHEAPQVREDGSLDLEAVLAQTRARLRHALMDPNPESLRGEASVVADNLAAAQEAVEWARTPLYMLRSLEHYLAQAPACDDTNDYAVRWANESPGLPPAHLTGSNTTPCDCRVLARARVELARRSA